MLASFAPTGLGLCVTLFRGLTSPANNLLGLQPFDNRTETEISIVISIQTFIE